jgi:hypothetical protein
MSPCAVALQRSPPPPGDAESAAVSPHCCVECGKMLSVDTGYVNAVSKKGKLYFNSACRPCQNHRVSVVAKLKQKHPHPPSGSPCECCGRIAKLFLDHAHDTDKFRGWCCQTCNSGIGMLGDSAEGLWRALAYLENHEGGRGAHNTPK